jgi:hypothetical protein
MAPNLEKCVPKTVKAAFLYLIASSGFANCAEAENETVNVRQVRIYPKPFNFMFFPLNNARILKCSVQNNYDAPF